MGAIGLPLALRQLRHSVDQYQATIKKEREGLKFSELLDLKRAYNRIKLEMTKTKDRSDDLSIANMLSGNSNYSLTQEKNRISLL
jgi:hypothetical protein